MNLRKLYNPIAVFVLAWLAWFGLLALLIYWYVSNYLIFIELGERISPQLILTMGNIFPLIGGIILLVTIAIGMILIFKRLTEYMKVTRMYDNFIANVTHELKSPLASLQLYLETLSTRRVPELKRQEFISLMIEDARRLSSLISSILEISGLEEKRQPFQIKPWEAMPLVMSLIEGARDQYKIPDDAVEIIGSVDCKIKVDNRAFAVVINNLFDNTVKYSQKPVHIRINLTTSRSKMIVEFSDDGIGISEKDQKEVFKKFRRVYNPESPTVKGTGLGLYWVREILKQHKGRISVRSEGRNAGTTFHIELPLYAPHYQEK